MTDDFTREEKALRGALAARANQVDADQAVAGTSPHQDLAPELHADQHQSPATRRGWLAVAAVAAGALVVAIAFALPRGGSDRIAVPAGSATTHRPSATGAPSPTQPPITSASGTTPQASPSNSHTGNVFPPAKPGWKWTSSLGVAVQVPDAWSFNSELPSWCIDDGKTAPTTPFVDNGSWRRPHPAIGCPERPHRLQVLHLVIAPSSVPVLDDRPGVSAVARLGDTTTNVHAFGRTLTASEQATSDAILASARTTDFDHHGCASLSVLQEPGFQTPPRLADLSQIDPAVPIRLCQYLTADSERPASSPGLVTSRVLTGTDAVNLVTAINSAPATSGPNEPDTCVEGIYGSTALQINLSTAPGPREVYFYYSWCRNNGFQLGHGQVRSLTRANCLPLFREPVTITSASRGPAEMCMA